MERLFVDCTFGLILKNKTSKLLLFFINSPLDYGKHGHNSVTFPNNCRACCNEYYLHSLFLRQFQGNHIGSAKRFLTLTIFVLPSSFKFQTCIFSFLDVDGRFQVIFRTRTNTFILVPGSSSDDRKSSQGIANIDHLTANRVVPYPQLTAIQQNVWEKSRTPTSPYRDEASS